MLQGYGTGSQNVYFMLGPNDASPKATTVSEAQSWGATQGRLALANWQSFYLSYDHPGFPIIYQDISESGYGWTSNKTLNRAEFNGFWNEVTGAQIALSPNQAYTIFSGVFAGATFWLDYMAGSLSETFEWTDQYSIHDSSLSSSVCPSAWSEPYGTANFFAGYSQSNPCSVAWQWAQGTADYDQVFATRLEDGMSASGACN